MTTNPIAIARSRVGGGEPDAAGIVAALEATTGVRCSANMGKPDRIMIDAVLSLLGPDVRSAVMVGDRLETDVRMAVNAGISSALVLTGDATRADVLRCEPHLRPDYVLEGIGDLRPRQTLAPPAAAV